MNFSIKALVSGLFKKKAAPTPPNSMQSLSQHLVAAAPPEGRKAAQEMFKVKDLSKK